MHAKHVNRLLDLSKDTILKNFLYLFVKTGFLVQILAFYLLKAQSLYLYFKKQGKIFGLEVFLRLKSKSRA